MGAHIVAQVFNRVQTSPAESAVLQTIAYAANFQGQNARIAYDAIALRTGFSQRWVITLIQRLEAKCLLRVHRRRLGYAIHDVNRYDIVRPWLRDMTMRQLYAKKVSASRPSERFVQRGETKEKTEEIEPIVYATHEDCLKLGMLPGSRLYALARGLPEPETNPQGTPSIIDQ